MQERSTSQTSTQSLRFGKFFEGWLDYDLTPTAFKLLAVFSLYADADGCMFVARNVVQQRAQMSERTYYRTQVELVKAGLLTVVGSDKLSFILELPSREAGLPHMAAGDCQIWHAPSISNRPINRPMGESSDPHTQFTQDEPSGEADPVALRITNERRIPEGQVASVPRLVDLQPVTKTAAARRRLALHLSTLTKQPPLWQGKDGKTWDRLAARYTEPVAMALIEEAARNRDRICTGAFADGHVTPSGVEFYAKHFFGAQPAQQESDLDVISNARREDGTWDEQHARKLAVVYDLPWDRVRDAIERTSSFGVQHSADDREAFEKLGNIG